MFRHGSKHLSLSTWGLRILKFQANLSCTVRSCFRKQPNKGVMCKRTIFLSIYLLP